MSIIDLFKHFTCAKEKERQRQADESITQKLQALDDEDDTDWNEAREHLEQVAKNIDRLSKQIKRHG